MTYREYYPNAFIIGAQKAGTTFLASCLDQHLDVAVSSPKEPQIMVKDGESYLEDYKACFPDVKKKVRIDASTTNSFLCRADDLCVEGRPGIRVNVPQKIKQIAPHAKIIYVLREPTERLSSAVRHQYLKRYQHPTSVSLLKFMDEDPMSRLRSEYSFQIDRYLEEFKAQSFIFIDYRILIEDPLGCVNNVLNALDLDPLLAIDENLIEKNSSLGANFIGAFLSNYIDRFATEKEALKRFVPAQIWKGMRNVALQNPIEISFSDYELAYDVFAAERRRISELTGIDFEARV